MSDENLADPGINPSLWINIVMPQCPPSSIQETLPWWHNSRTMQTASSEANKPPRAAVIELEYNIVVERWNVQTHHTHCGLLFIDIQFWQFCLCQGTTGELISLLCQGTKGAYDPWMMKSREQLILLWGGNGSRFILEIITAIIVQFQVLHTSPWFTHQWGKKTWTSHHITRVK